MRPFPFSPVTDPPPHDTLSFFTWCVATPPLSWWGYDSFEGLPETVGSERVAEWSKGVYAHDPRRHYLRRYGSSMAFVPGFYED